MLIKRAIEDQIFDLLGSNKVILILGTRRVGKTFLVNRIRERYQGKFLALNAEDVDVQEMLRKRSVSNYTCKGTTVYGEDDHPQHGGSQWSARRGIGRNSWSDGYREDLYRPDQGG